MAERKVYKTMQGKSIDMESLMARNETMPAIGNVRMNARGDELGPGGVVVRKREDIVNDHYVAQSPIRPMLKPQTVSTPVQPTKSLAKESTESNLDLSDADKETKKSISKKGN